LVSRGFSQFYHQLLYSHRKSEGRPQEEGATGRQSFCCGQLGKNSFNSSARGSAKPDKPEVSAPFSCDFPGFPMVWQEKAPWVGPKKGSWVKILRPESYWWGPWHFGIWWCRFFLRRNGSVSKPIVPLVNIKIAGKWMFIPLKMVCIGIDP